MPWPTTQLPLRVKIAPGANPNLAPNTWPSWVDVTAAVRVADGVDIDEGRQNEAALVDAGAMSLTLDARGAGAFSVADFIPNNPNGQWFGLLKRNCPIRVGVDVGADDFNRTSSSGWGNLSAPGVSPVVWNNSGTLTDWTISGGKAQILMTTANQLRSSLVTNGNASDVEGRFTASSPVLVTGGPILVSGVVRYVDAQNYYAFHLQFDTSSTMRIYISRLKNNLFANFATMVLPAPYTVGQEWTCAYQAIGSTFAMKAWPTLSPEPAGWQLGAADSASLVGATNGMIFWRTSSNTNAGSVTMSIDNFALEDIEWSGGITEFPVRWDQNSPDSTVPLKAAGVFRRLQQGRSPVKSPLLRQLSGTLPLTALWMMEDDAGSLNAASAIPNGTPAYASGITFGASADLPGSLQQARIEGVGSKLSGSTKLRVPTGSTGFSVVFFLRFPSAFSGATDLITIGSTGKQVQWVFRYDATQVTLNGIYDDGTTSTSGPIVHGLDVTKWFAMSLSVSTVGSTLTWIVYVHQVGVGNSFGTFTGNFSTSIVHSATSFAVTGSAISAGSFIGPVRFGDNTFPFISVAFRNVAAAWYGESAGARIARLCSESGVPCYVESGSTEPMGVQRVDSLFSLLRECEAADFGILFEAGFGVAYRPRANRYSRSTIFSLDRASGHLAAPPEPTMDDQALRNDVSLSRDGGAQNVRAYDQASIDAEGIYDDSATINVATDTQLADQAGWRVYLGIQPDLRWPSLQVDLRRNPSILPAWRSRVFGDRLMVSNMPTQVAANTPDVIVEGVSQHLSAFEWSAQINASPARPWDVATLDDTLLRMDTAGSTISTAPSPAATGTSFAVATPSGPVWVTTAANPAEFPFNITVAGEPMTVTAITGATSPQTFTVTRSIAPYSVVKAQVVGADVRLLRPMILAL